MQVSSFYSKTKKTKKQKNKGKTRKAQSIENYDFIIFRSEIWPILMYLFRVSFLTNLDLYKAYF